MLTSTIEEFLEQLQAGPRTEPGADENWSALVKRISRSGQIRLISEEVFTYWLECFPPYWRADDCLCCVDGGAYRLFWKHADRYCCSQLTRGETLRFCALTGLAISRVAARKGGIDN